MHHPWRAFRQLASWDLVWAPLPVDVAGITSWADRTVTLRRGMTQAQRRSVIEHERLHCERGPVLDDPALVAREEAAIDQAAARNLIGIRELGEALAWATTLDEAAEELWVDRHTLNVRLAHLHPAERAYLKRRLSDEQDD